MQTTVLRAGLRRSGWCLRLRPGQRAGASNLRRLAQGFQQGSALSLQFVHLVTLTGKKCPPPHKGASQQRGVAAQPRLPICQPRRSRAPVPVSSGCRGLVWSGLGRACGQRKSMFLDDTVKAKKTACGSIAHAGRCRPLSLEPGCAGAVGVFVCAQASALALQTCAASRRAFSRAQHFLCNSCTCVTDACPWPHRVSDALPGRAAAHCQLLVTLTGKKCPPPHKGASQQPCSAAAPSHLPAQAQSRPRAGVLWLQRPCVVRAWACLRPTQKYVSR